MDERRLPVGVADIADEVNAMKTLGAKRLNDARRVLANGDGRVRRAPG